MTGTNEPVAVIGVGTMGHGMATSALRAGIPTIVWDRTPRRDPKPCRVGRRGRRERGGRRSASRDRRHDGARRRRGRRDRHPRGHAGRAGARLDLGTDEHDRRGGYRARRSPSSSTQRPDVTLVDAPVSGSKDPAEQGELTIFASGPDDARAAPHSPVRRTRSPDPLGRAGRHRHAREDRQQHLARLRCRSGRRIRRACRRVGPRHPNDDRRARGGTARLAVAIGQAPTRREGRLLRAVRIAARARRTYASPSTRRATTGSTRSGRWPTSGRKSSRPGSATRTSPS